MTNVPQGERRRLRTEGAADYLGVGESTLKHSPDVPRRKRDGVVLFRRDELDAWVVDDHYEGASRYRNGSRTVPYREAQAPFPPSKEKPRMWVRGF